MPKTGRERNQMPNLQNMPIRTSLGADLREISRTRPVTNNADYSAAEMRIARDLIQDAATAQDFLELDELEVFAKTYGAPSE